MFGRKAKRIVELELEARAGDLALQALKDKHERVLMQVESMQGRIARQRRSLREMHAGIAADRKLSREAADLARLAVARMTTDYPGAARHDGNHPVEQCEACAAFKALEPFATRPWHRAIRARGGLTSA